MTREGKRKNTEDPLEDDHQLQAKVHRQESATAILTDNGTGRNDEREARKKCKAAIARVYASYRALNADEDVVRNFQVLLDAAKGRTEFVGLNLKMPLRVHDMSGIRVQSN
jgi:hypothetical protein